jgi:hypothetical protein
MPNNTTVPTHTVKSTFDYDSFVILDANRDVDEGHIRRLQRQSEDVGNITFIQPITVNENMEVIDGQHRLEVAKERGDEVFYLIVPGLRIEDAVNMNVNHRSWTPADYAKSYSTQGNSNYQRYLDLREEFGFAHTQTVLAINGGEQPGMQRAFRTGDMLLPEERMEGLRERLTLMADLQEALGHGMTGAVFAAMWRTINMDSYDHPRLLQRLEWQGSTIGSFSNTTDALRAIEDVYNYRYTDANRVRLF